MRQGRHLLTCLGVVLLFTLLASAAHAGGVCMSSRAVLHHAHVAACEHFLADTDIAETHTALLTAYSSRSAFPTLTFHHTKSCALQATIAPSRPATALLAFHRQYRASQFLLHAYADYPRPPTTRQ